MGQRQHRGRAEAVAADRRGGGHRQRQHPGQQRLHAPDIPLGLVAVGRQPVEVKPVGVELAGRHGDQPCRAQRYRIVEVRVELVEKLWRETVFVVAEVQQGDGVLETEGNGHRRVYSGSTSRRLVRSSSCARNSSSSISVTRGCTTAVPIAPEIIAALTLPSSSASPSSTP